jgi:hypothetical protein
VGCRTCREQRGAVGLPRSIKQVQELGLVLSAYTHTHYTHVLLAFLGAYVLYASSSSSSSRKAEEAEALGPPPLLTSSCLDPRCVVWAMASLQSFSIPGSIFMSFLGGALFGLPVGFCVVTLVRMLPPTPPAPPTSSSCAPSPWARGRACAHLADGCYVVLSLSLPPSRTRRAWA